MHRSDSATRCTQLVFCLLLAVAAAGWAPLAAAAAAACTTTTGTLSLPSATVGPQATVGTLLGSPTSITMIFSCTGLPIGNTTADRTTTIQAGDTLATLASTNVPAGPGITFATNLTGIGVLVTATPADSSQSGSPSDGPNSLAGYQVGSVVVPAGTPTGTKSGTVTSTYTAQLIVTGPITATSVGAINANTLIPFWWYVSGGSTSDNASQGPIGNLALASSAVTLQACTVSTGSQNLTVTLPTTTSSALTAVGATSGKTAFSISLTCVSGATASINMTTANPATATGVIAPTAGTGFAKNVGIQLLNSSGTAVAFNSAQTLGATPNGNLSIPYFAQYYVTATPVSAGLVTGTVTFTMSYL
jgi:type 1 fimbria pilin